MLLLFCHGLRRPATTQRFLHRSRRSRPEQWHHFPAGHLNRNPDYRRHSCCPVTVGYQQPNEAASAQPMLSSYSWSSERAAMASLMCVVHGTCSPFDAASRAPRGETECHWRFAIDLISPTRSLCKTHPHLKDEQNEEPSVMKLFLHPFKTT